MVKPGIISDLGSEVLGSNPSLQIFIIIKNIINISCFFCKNLLYLYKAIADIKDI